MSDLIYFYINFATSVPRGTFNKSLSLYDLFL